MEQLPQVNKWAEGYSKFELQVAIEGFNDHRELVKFTIDENPNSNTKPELLMHRTLSLLIMKLEALQIGRV